MSKSKTKKGYGRKRLADEVDTIAFILPAFEKRAFEELCENKGLKISERMQLLVARDLHREKNQMSV